MNGLQLSTVCLSVLLLVGCANMSVRHSQDWSQVEDARLFRTVQVGNWGSGVILEHTNDRMLVLTCAHLVKENQSISVYVVDPDTRRYRRLSARVFKRTHPHKEDLALLTVDNPPAVLTPLHVGLADDFAEGEERKVAIMSVSIGAKERPSSREGRVFQYTMSISSFVPDESGDTTWKLAKGTLHGGIVEANSGSPVFQGERLVGLAESAPGIGIKGSEIFSGVQTSLPQTIRGFLVEAMSRTREPDK